MKNITQIVAKKAAFFLSALFAAGLIQSAQAVCTPVSSGLVGWWQGEVNAIDFTGTNNGTVLVATNYQPGEVGQGFGMNGVSGAVRIPASPSLNVGLAGGMTVEAWIYPSNTSAQSLFEWSMDGNVANYETHFWRGHPFYPTCNLFANIVDTNDTAHELYSFGPIISGTFEHVAMTYDKATGIGRLFINGQMVNETALGTFTPKTMDTLYLGERPPGDPYSNVFVGRIDEASLYNRALTTNEIVSIYNASNAGKCTGILAAPTIASQPTNQTVALNGTAFFSVFAQGTAPLFYQWKLSGTNLPGKTNSDLTLVNVQPSQAGNYSVLVSNSVSTVISSNAALVVVVPVCTPPPSGMVAWWPGEGNANDIVGTNKGTVLVATNYRPGEVGQSFGMNGVGGAVRIPASPSLNVGLAGGMTLEAWIYPSNTSAQSLFEWSLDGNVGNYETHFWRGHPFYPTCNLFANIVDTNNVAHELYSFGPIISGTFEHVAMTYDKTTGIGRLFINSQIVNETLLGTFTPKTKDTLYLGQRPPGDPYSNVFVGRIDEASIYNRALTTNEIASIYNSASAGKCTPCTPSPSGMVGWWPGEGNGNDIVGVNPAIIGAGVTYPPSEVGLGFLLNNPTNASFKIPKSSSLNVGLSAGFTVETWIKPSSVNGYHPIFEWFDEVAQVNGIQFWIGLDPSSQGVLAVAMLDANGNNFSLLSSPSGTLVSNAWQHVALTYDRGTHLIRLLVNGAVVAQSTWAGDVPRTGFNIWVGQHPTTCIGCSSAGVYLGGPLDELSLYNRALTTNEIAVIYSAGSAGKCAVVNHPPVAGSIFTLGVKIGVPSTVKIIGGKHPPTDVDNDALTISSVAGAVNGSTSTDGTNVTYTATTGSTDSFNCTISDGHGGIAIQTVNVAITANGGLGFNQLSPQSLGGGTNVLTFLGTPNFRYALERATNLVPPVVWLSQVTNTAQSSGYLIFTNVTGLSPVFYRTRYVP